MDRQFLSAIGAGLGFALVGGLAFATFVELYSLFNVVPLP